MARPYVVTGTLSHGRIVELDVPVPLDDTKVRVTLEPLASEPARSLADVIGEIHRRQALRGHAAPTRDEVDRLVTTERESWGE